MIRSLERERGFTLVELLVAMAIAGILISLIFAVYTRMSVAYQGQNRITAVVQNVRAAQDRFTRELRMAGNQLPQADYRPLELAGTGDHFAPNHQVPVTANMHDINVDWNGIKVAATVQLPGQPAGHPIQPVYITNGGGQAPDQIRFFYADTSTASKVDTILLGDTSVVDLVDHDPIDAVSPTSRFANGDFIVLVNTTQEKISMDVTGDATLEIFDVTAYEACLLQLTGISGDQLQFNEVSSYNTYRNGLPVQSHCDDVAQQHAADTARPAAARTDTVAYVLEGRSYRLDPAQPAIGILEFHPNGELDMNEPWAQLGIGFTNLQIASRWFENANAADPDLIDGPALDWYSGENQEFPDPTPIADINRRPETAVLVALSVSIEARSFAEVKSPTTQIGGFQQGANANFNPLGDSPALALPSVDPRYAGDFIYRWSTINFELRNLGRGR